MLNDLPVRSHPVKAELHLVPCLDLTFCPTPSTEMAPKFQAETGMTGAGARHSVIQQTFPEPCPGQTWC